MKCTWCHTNNEGFRLLCQTCDRPVDAADEVVLGAPTSVEDPARWNILSKLLRVRSAHHGLAANVPAGSSYVYLLESQALLDDFTTELAISVRPSAPDKAAGFALEIRRQGKEYYRAEALSSGSYRFSRVVDGTSTTAGFIRVPALSVSTPRKLYVSARGDRLQFAADGKLVLSIRDGAHRFGSVRLLAVPGDSHGMELEISRLAIAVRR